MSKKQGNTSVNDDPILSAFDEAKEEQLSLLDMGDEEQAEINTPKKKVIDTDKQEDVQEVEDTVQEDSTDEAEETQGVMYTGYDGIQYSEEEWNSPVVKNGPTRMEVEEWKERYGGLIYFTPFEGDVFVWRTLQRPEYREIIRDTTLNALDREEYFTEKCVIYPRNFSIEKIKKSRAGIASLLSEMIMDKSGFVAQSAPIKL